MVSSSSVLNTRAVAERLLQALGDGVDAALLRHVLAEQQRLRDTWQNRSCSALLIWIARCRGGCFSGSFASLPNTCRRRCGVVGARWLRPRPRPACTAPAARSRRRARSSLRTAVGFLGGGEALLARVLVQRQQFVLRHQPGFERDRGASAAADRSPRPRTAPRCVRHSISKSVPAWPMIRVVRRCRKVGRRVRRQCSTARCTSP